MIWALRQVTRLIPGPVRVVLQNGSEQIYYVSGGFLEVQSGVVTVLADTALRADDVNEAAALKAIEDANEAITNKSSEFEYSRAATQLAEATAQLRALRQMRK